MEDLREASLALQNDISNIKDQLKCKREHLQLLRKNLNERSLQTFLNDSEVFYAEEERASAREIDALQSKLDEKQQECDEVLAQMECQAEVVREKQGTLAHGDELRQSMTSAFLASGHVMNLSVVEREHHVDAIDDEVVRLMSLKNE